MIRILEFLLAEGAAAVDDAHVGAVLDALVGGFDVGRGAGGRQLVLVLAGGHAHLVVDLVHGGGVVVADRAAPRTVTPP